jgi:hypothetical protein
MILEDRDNFAFPEFNSWKPFIQSIFIAQVGVYISSYTTPACHVVIIKTPNKDFDPVLPQVVSVVLAI